MGQKDSSFVHDGILRQCDPNSRFNWAWRMGVLLLVVLAFLFRTHGLSHDLDLGKNYHPDTPKQIRMAERYTQGIFYYEVYQSTARDYDGYPYFLSLLAAGVYRATEFTVSIWRDHVGIARTQEVDRYFQLEWIARFINVVFSAGAVLVLYLLGTRVAGRWVGLGAACLLTISPLDIAACHYGTGDTGAAFFALVSLYFSVSIYQRGTLFDYLMAAATGVCSFSAKYHGGFVMFVLIAAHMLRARSIRDMFGLVSWCRAALVALVVGIVFVITTPGMMVRPERTVGKIVQFLKYSEELRASDPATRAMSTLERFGSSVQANLPVFARFMGPIFLGFAFLGVIRSFFMRREWILISLLPILYVVMAISVRTARNPVYATLITPSMFLLAVLQLSQLSQLRRFGWFPKVLSFGLLVFASVSLAHTAYREMFFFRNADTRLMADRWIRETVPENWEIVYDRYGGLSRDLLNRQGPFDGTAFVRTDRRSPDVINSFLAHTVYLEKDALPQFRNFAVGIYFEAGGSIRENWCLPVFQQVASQFDTEICLVGTPEVFRSARIVPIETGKSVTRTLVSDTRLTNPMVAVQCGRLPTEVNLSVAGKRGQWFLLPGETVFMECARPVRRPPFTAGFWAYGISAASSRGPVQVTWATQDHEKGILLFQAGRYSEALPWLRQAGAQAGPAVTAIREICQMIVEPDARATTQRQGPVLGPVDGPELTDADMVRMFGIGEQYLGKVEFLKWPQVDIRNDTNSGVQTVSVPLTFLPAGAYVARLQYAVPGEVACPTEAEWSVTDAAGSHLLPKKSVALEPGPSGMRWLELPFEVPSQPGAKRVAFRMTGGNEIQVGMFEIRPNPLETLRVLKRTLAAVVYGHSPQECASPANYDILMAMGDALLRKGDTADALGFYIGAQKACPTRAEPAAAIQRLLPRVRSVSLTGEVADCVSRYFERNRRMGSGALDVTYDGNIRLTGYELSTTRIRAGESVGLRLSWDVRRLRVPYERRIVWVHFVGKDGTVAFQGDRVLSSDLARSATIRTLGDDDYFMIAVPPSVPAGSYQVRVGLWVPWEHRNLRAESSTVPIIRKGAEIAELTVLQGVPGDRQSGPSSGRVPKLPN